MKVCCFLLTGCLLCIFITATNLQAQPTPVRIGGGNTAGVQVTGSDSTTTRPQKTIDGLGLLPNAAAASRFLAQSTLGADLEAIQAMQGTSYAEWLEEQCDQPRAFRIEELTRELTIMALDSTFEMGGDVDRIMPRLFFWHTAWWQYTMTSPDLLRQRVALALSEIFVISEVGVLEEYPLALANYYDMLLDNALGNFRDLLENITFHPAMGVYLTHMNNPKAKPEIFRFPDENYAREVKQLFTIGLYELNLDGSRKTDGNGNPIPTYNNKNIQEYAKVFTGLTFGDAYLFGQGPQSELSFTVPMMMVNTWHSPGPKYLLRNDTIPDRSPVDGLADIQDALDNLFNHPNVGPFICRLLIQRLVKSNPSPDYIQRIAQVFNDNGQGVRGDLAAVVKAILLDPEARDCYWTEDPFQGMLREPILRYTQLCRAFNAASDEGLFRNSMYDFYRLTFQRPLASPSVFNFFQPDYQPIGMIADNDLVAPEFQIANSITIIGYANRLHDWLLMENDIMEFDRIFHGEDWDESKEILLNLEDEFALGTDEQLHQLIDRLDLILAHGQLSQETHDIIFQTIQSMPESESEFRVRMAMFLVMVSPDYLILR